MRYRVKAVLLAFTLMGLSQMDVAAQTTLGKIICRVTDPSSSVVPRAALSLVNAGTGVRKDAISGEDGEYQFLLVPPGRYSLDVKKEGFEPSVFNNLVIDATRVLRLDVHLAVGPTNQTVTVNTAPPAVSTDDASISTSYGRKILEDTPVNGRTISSLIALASGMPSNNGSWPQIGGTPYWGGTHFNVDGASVMDFGNGAAAYNAGSQLTTLPANDAIQELKIGSNATKAEFEGAASVTVVTRSGSNAWHGSMLAVNRNRELAARNFFAAGPVGPYNRNEFGFTLGNPILKNKLFDFVSYEGWRQRTSISEVLTVPTLAVRGGDFTGRSTIIDPYTGSPFPNNIIPASRINSVSAKLLTFYPQPTSAGTSANYRTNVPSSLDVDRGNVRLDYVVTNKDTVTANYSRSVGNPISSIPGAFPATWGSHVQNNDTTGATLAHSRILSPTLYNELRFSYFNHTRYFSGLNSDFDPTALIPGLFPLTNGGGLPGIDITGITSMGDYGKFYDKQYTSEWIDNLSIIRGRHAIKLGVDLAREWVSWAPYQVGHTADFSSAGAAFGVFSFNGRYTSGGAATGTTSQAFGDFLLGYAAATARSSGTPTQVYSGGHYSGYIQDDWQATSRLTVNIGLRLMEQPAWTERSGMMANLDFSTGRLVVPGKTFPSQGQQQLINTYPIVTSSAAGWPDRSINDSGVNWAPRLGLAYRPFRNNKTVLRAAAGLYYSPVPLYIGAWEIGSANPPFALAQRFESAAGLQPSLTFNNAFPGSGTVTANPSIYAVQRDLKDALSNQWNATVEHEVLPGVDLRASYLGNRGVHLSWYAMQVNLPKVQVPGTLQSARPYQPWSGINYTASGGDLSFHALELEGKQRLANGLVYQVQYTFARSIDDVPPAGGPQDPYNFRADRGNTGGLPRHRFSAVYSYELPFGRNRKWFGHGALGNALGNLSLAGITMAQTGTPFSVGFSSSLPGWISSRADFVGNPGVQNPSISGWFNPNAFAVPARFQYGNSARNLLFGPGSTTFDLSLIKSFTVRDRINCNLRVDAFNAFNHANFGNPASNISDPGTVGKIYGAAPARTVQLGAKVTF